MWRWLRRTPRLASAERSPLASCAIIASGMSKKRGARMHIFITGATGYIGGAVAARLLADGHRVFGLARTPEKARALAARGIAPVAGALVDLGTLREAAQAADAVINAASADDSMVAHVLVQALEGSGKPLLHTSGTSVAADRALGERSDVVFTEDMPLQTLPERLLRIEVERSVLGAAGRGVRSVVIRPALLTAAGRGSTRTATSFRSSRVSPSPVAGRRMSAVGSMYGRTSTSTIWPSCICAPSRTLRRARSTSPRAARRLGAI